MVIKNISDRKIFVILFSATIISILADSVFLDRITVSLIFISCILLGEKEKSFINPYNLFSIAPLSLSIYYNVSNTYMMDLTHETYTLAIINMVSFIFILHVTPNVKYIKNDNCSTSTSTTFLKVNVILLFSLALLENFIPMLQSILWLFSIAGMVCAMKTKQISMIFLIFAYLINTALGETSKMAMLAFIIVLLTSYEKYYLDSKRYKTRLKVFAIIGIAFLIFSFSFANKDRGYYDANYGLNYFSKQGVEWQYNTTLFLPYMYITTPWANLQYVIESQDTRTNGLWTLKPILGYFQLDNIFKNEYVLKPYSSFNTFTFIAVGFKDFGYWMSIFPTLLLGFVVKKIYSRYLISMNPFDVATYAIIGLAVVELFFSNHFYMYSYPFTMILLMWVYKLIVCSKSKKIRNVFYV